MATNTVYFIFHKKSDSANTPQATIETKTSTGSVWLDWNSSGYIQWVNNKNRLFRFKFDTTTYSGSNYKCVNFPDCVKFFRIATTPTGFTDDYVSNVELLNAEWEQITQNELPENLITDIYNDISDGNYYETGFTLNAQNYPPYDYAMLFLYPLVVSRTNLKQFTANLTNCTTNITENYIGVRSTICLTVTPDSGYEFKEVPTLSNGATFTLLNDGSYASEFQVLSDFTLTASAVESGSTTKYTFTQNLTNCTTNISDTEIEENTNVNLTVTPDNGYEFKESPTLSNGATFTELDGVYSATFTMTENVTLTASAVVKPTNYEIKINASNVTYTIYDKNSNDISTLGYWNTDMTPITFSTKPNSGYYFETLPKVAYFDALGQQRTITLTLDEESGYYIGTVTPISQYLSFVANASVITTITNKYGLITAYNLQTEDLKEIAKARYFYETKGQYEEQFYKDLGDFISKLHIMYVSFDSLRTQRLYLGNYPITEALYPVIDDNVIILDCGSININEKYKNVVDYNATIKIMLPFIGFKELSIVDVMDKTIHLYYKADVITGNAIAYLTTDINDVEIIIDSFDCTMSYNIPFVSLTDIEKTYNLNDNFLYGFDAYVIINTPRIVGDNYTYGNSSNIVDSIGNFTGYCSFSDITLSTTATETEQNEILSLLERGVII